MQLMFSNTLLSLYYYELKFAVMFPAITGFETNNKYEIKNSVGQRVYFAAEGTTTFPHACIK
jgi:hypothetical protein